jgi:hypothetical protein
MQRSLFRYPALAAFAALIVGCADGGGGTLPPPSNLESRLIDEEASTHHFGAVISTASRKLSHRYRLVNAAQHDVRIVELINRKPCCGEVLAEKTLLRPGDETGIEVRLSVSREFGDVVHEAVVVTEPPRAEDLVLRTMAKVYPPIRVEEATPINGSILLTSDKPRPVEFQVFAQGSSAEPPADLDRLELRSTIKVDWAGPKEGSASDDGLRIESRRFTALLDPAGSPGMHKAEILLRDGELVRYRHVVSWEAVSPIMASPKMIVIKPGERDYRVLVRSRDQKSFRIMRIECTEVGIRGRAANTVAALIQTVEVVSEGTPRPEGARGVITVFTDHPAQGKVDVPFIVLD